MRNSFCRPPALWMVTVLVLLTACQAKRPKESNPYERYLSEVHARGQFNGTALVFDQGEVVYQGAFGLRSADTNDSLDLDAQFRLASVSKTFTSMAIMLLKEDGKLRYDQDIRDFLPELPYTGITIRHLLHHTSGLPDYEPLMDQHWKPDLATDDPARYTDGNADVLKLLAESKAPVNFAPGDRWQYSNTGYNLLGTIVDRAAGMSFAEYLKLKVFEPAGMTHTVLYDYVAGLDAKMPDRAYGFQVAWNGKDMKPNDSHYLNRGLGEDGVYSTVGDMLKWDRILYTDKLVSRATLEEAFTPAVLNNGDTTNYGFGWFIDRSPTGKKVVAHSGGWLGFITYFYRAIEEDKCYVILTNNSTIYYGNKGVRGGLNGILYEQPYALPTLSLREQMGKDVFNLGVEQAIANYHGYRSARPKDDRFDEGDMNDLGYELMREGRLGDAAAVLELTLEEYPGSANAHDSYGDALLAKGDTLGALGLFKKALVMDSTLIVTKEKIDAIISKLPQDGS